MGKLKCKAVLKGHHDAVWSVSFHPTDNLIASCGTDKTIKIWKIKNHQSQIKNNENVINKKDDDNKKEEWEWECIATLKDGHSKTIRNIAWSPCGSYLASASFDATTCIWDKVDNQYDLAASLEGHENEVKCVAWSNSDGGAFMATCSRDKSVWVWSVEGDNEFECMAVLNEHSQDVKFVLFHPLKNILFSCSYDDTIKCFAENDEGDWECYSTLEGHKSTVWALAVTKDGSRMASCSDDQTIKIWINNSDKLNRENEIETGSTTYVCVSTISGHFNRPIYSIDYNADNSYLVASGADNTIRIFAEEVENVGGQTNVSLVLLDTNKDHSQDVNCVRFHPSDPRILASCSDDGDVRLYSFE